MLTSKQRATLRAMASAVEPVFQIGKGNLSEVQLNELDAALLKRELIKISVLRSSENSADELIEIIANRLRAEPVAVIGNKIVIYRRNDDKKERIEI